MSREQNEKYMSITGIDGAGKSSVALGIVSNVMREISVAYIGSLGQPSFLARPNDAKTMLYPALSKNCRRIYDEGQRKNRDPMILMAFVLHSLICHRFAEPTAIQMGADLIIRDRDPFVDPAVVLASYNKGFFPISFLLTSISLLAAPPKTDLLIHLVTSPRVASERLKKRSSFQDRHESLDALTKASGLYDKTIQLIMNQGYIGRLFTLENNSTDLQPVINQVATVTRNNFSKIF